MDIDQKKELEYDPEIYESLQAKIEILRRDEQGMQFEDNLAQFRSDYGRNGEFEWQQNTHTFVKDCIRKGWPPVPTQKELRYRRDKIIDLGHKCNLSNGKIIDLFAAKHGSMANKKNPKSLFSNIFG